MNVVFIAYLHYLLAFMKLHTQLLNGDFVRSDQPLRIHVAILRMVQDSHNVRRKIWLYLQRRLLVKVNDVLSCQAFLMSLPCLLFRPGDFHLSEAGSQ